MNDVSRDKPPYREQDLPGKQVLLVDGGMYKGL